MLICVCVFWGVVVGASVFLQQNSGGHASFLAFLNPGAPHEEVAGCGR